MRNRAFLLVLLTLFIRSDSKAQQPADDPRLLAPCSIEGQILLPDGLPAVGAEIAIRTLQANSDRVRLYGLPLNWSDPAPMVTDADGRFEISFVPPGALQFVLDAGLEGYAPAKWRWSKLEPGSSKVLEPLRLELACWIEGHVEDREGNLIAERVQIFGSVAQEPQGERVGLSYTAAVNPDMGIFRMGPLPPGPVSLRAQHANGSWSEKTRVLAKPKDGKRAILRFTGEPISSKIVFQCSFNPYMGARLKDPSDYTSQGRGQSQLVLLDEAGEVLQHARHVQGTSQTFEFRDVAMGEYTVELRDPRFKYQSLYRITPGEENMVPLVGSSAIVLEVLDANGNPLDVYGLRVGYVDSGHTPGSFEIRAPGSTAPPDGRFDSIVPGDLFVEVTSPAGLVSRRELGMVEPGQTIEATVRIEEVAAIRGRVLAADGQPAAGVKMEVTRGEYAGLPLGGSSNIPVEGGGMVQLGSYDFDVVSSADGSFVVDKLESDTWTVRALVTPYAWVTGRVEIAAGSDAELVLQLPQLGELRGQLRADHDFDFSRLKGKVVPSAWTLPETLPFQPREAVRPHADGSFVIAGLPQGAATVHLWLPRPSGKNGWGDSVGPAQEITIGRDGLDWSLDVTGLLPVAGQARIRVNGEPAPNVHITLVEESRVDQEGSFGISRRPLFVFAPAGAGGLAEVVAPKQGVVYRAILRSNNRDWIGDGGLLGPFESEADVHVDLDVDLCVRTLQVYGSGGGPLAQTDVGWGCLYYQGDQCHGMTDDQAQIELSLPAGTYTLFRHGLEPRTEVEFTMERGVGPIAVRLP